MAALTASSAQAQTNGNWTGTSGVDANWSTGANWVLGTPPTTGAATVLSFTTNSTLTTDLNNDLVNLGINRMVLGDAATTTSYVLGGNTVWFNGTTANITTTAALLQTINLPISLTTALTVTNNGTAAGTDLILGGLITLTTGNSLTFRGTGDTLVSGAITNGIGGAGGVTKADAGALILTGVNSFTGAFTINQGSVTITSGGTIFSGSAGAGSIIMGRAAGTSLLTLTVGAIQTTGVSLSFGGATATATSQATIDLGEHATLTTILNLGGNVTYSNTNNPLGAVITGTNARINLTGSRTFDVRDSTNAVDDLSILVPISGTGTAGITKTGNGNLLLAGQNTFTGAVSINQGSVTMSSGSTLFTGSGGIGTFVLGRGVGVSLLTLTDGVIDTTGVQISIGGSGANSTTQSTVDLGSYAVATNILNLGGTLTYSSTGNPLGATITGVNAQMGINGGRTINVADSTGAVDDLSILVPLVNGSSTGTLTKTGTGTLVLGASSTYGGSTTINAGLVALTTTNALPSNQAVLLATSNTGTAGLELRGAISQTITNLTFYSSSSAAISQGAVTTGTQGNFTVNGNITVNNNNNPLGASIVGTSSGVLTVTGNRTWTINDSSNAATELLISVPSTVLTSSNVKVGAGVLQFDGATALSGAGGWDVRNGTIQLQGSNSLAGINTLRAGTLWADYTQNNVGDKLSGNATHVLQGGTLQMTGNAAADSALTLTNGLTLGAGFGRVTIDVQSQTGFTTAFDVGAVTRAPGTNLIRVQYSGTGTSSLLTSSGTSGEVLGFAYFDDDWATRASGAGSTRVSAFTNYDVKNNAATWASGDDITFNANIQSSRPLTSLQLNSLRMNQSGDSVVNLGGARVTLTNGVLVGTGAGSFPRIFGGILAGNNNELVVIQNDTSPNGTFTISSLIDDLTGLNKFGPGTLVLDGRNSFTGAVTIVEGTLIADAANNGGVFARGIGDTSTVFVGNGTFEVADNTRERIGALSSVLSLSSGSVNIGAGSQLILNTNTAPAQNYLGSFNGGATSTLVKDGIATLLINQDNNAGFTGSVIINRGVIQLDGDGVNGGLGAATSWTVNQDGALVLDDAGNSGARTRILSTSTVTLVGANGQFGSIATGLMHRAADNRNESETIGSLSLGGGSSYIRLDNTGAANEPSTRAGIAVGGSLTRSENATLSVRGSFLGFDGDGTAGVGSRTRLFFNSTDTANPGGAGTGPAEFGSGTDSGVTRFVIPYVIAEFVGTAGTTSNNAGTAVAAANRGNSFATYSDSTDASGAGLRALVVDPAVVLNSTVAEYTTLAGITSTNDNVRESLSASLAVAGSPTMQSLVVNNAGTSNITLTGAGAGAVLTVNSGGFLFNGTSRGITLTNFGGGIQVNNASYITANSLGVRNEYIVHQMNTTTTGVMIGSALTTTDADFTKSGIGRLTFTTGVVNLFQGMVTVNEGILEVANNAHLGDNASSSNNDIRLAGGTLRIAGTGFTTNNRDLSLIAGTLSQIELTGAAAHRITGSVTQGGGLRINTTGTGTGRALQLGTVGATFSMGTGADSSDLIIGRATSATAAFGELDLSQSTGATLNLDELLIGDADVAGAAGLTQAVLRLASTGTNSVTARSIVISDNATGDNTPATNQSSLIAGAGTTTLAVDSLTVGGRKGNGLITGGTGRFNVRGRAGTFDLADVYIADNSVLNTSTVTRGEVNLLNSFGSNWSLNQLVIGRHGSGSGGAVGTLTLGFGVTVSAESVLLGRSDYLGDSTNDSQTIGTINLINHGTLNFGVLRKGNGIGVINVNDGSIGARGTETAVNENVPIVLSGDLSIGTGFNRLTLGSDASISGAGNVQVSGFGELYLLGAMTHTGGTEIQLGPTTLGADNRLPVTTTLNVNSGGVFNLNGFNQAVLTLSTTVAPGIITNSGGSNSIFTVGAGTFSGTITNGSSPLSLVKNTAGTLILSGTNGYTGGTTVGAGTLAIGAGGRISGTGDVWVQNNSILNVQTSGLVTIGGNVTTTGSVIANGTIGGRVIVEDAGILSGTGSIGGLTLNPGGTLSPGNSVGTLTITGTDPTVWGNNTTIFFEFKDAGGIAGIDWDLINLSSSVLQITATTAAKITLRVDSWQKDNGGHGGGQSEGLDFNNFDPLGTYSWMFASTGGLSPDYDTASLQSLFDIQDQVDGAGVFGTNNPFGIKPLGASFAVIRTGDNLFLTYDGGAAIPEPGTFLLAAVAAAGYGWRRRRNRRAAGVSAPSPVSG